MLRSSGNRLGNDCSARFALVFALCLVGNTLRVFGWGSYEDGYLLTTKTHHAIDEGAHAFVLQDPAFQGVAFPSIAQVLGNEGASDMGKTGNGPDKEGASLYSWHYYNPTTTKGKAPTKISSLYSTLAEQLTRGSLIGAPRSSAWAAHFLADMSCPYHVFGMPRSDAEAIWKGVGSNKVVYLPSSALGSIQLMSYMNPDRKRTEITIQGRPTGQFTVPNTNFYQELANYAATALPVVTQGDKKNSHLDWFDPWYFNTGVTPISSHIGWEGNSWQAFTFNPSARSYSPLWAKTGAPKKPNPDQPWTENAERILKLAQEEALYTQGQVATEIGNIGPGYRRSVLNVYTLWRAAVSGLKPGVTVTDAGATPEGNAIYKVTPFAANKLPDASFGNTEVRFTILGGATEKKKPATLAPVNVPASGKVDFGEWELEVTDPKNCAVRIEVYGLISTNMPDLQYACIETNLMPADVENSLVFLVDGSSSMSGAKIAAAKSSAASSIGRAATERSEIAVFCFHGSGVNRISSFTVATDKGKAELKRQIGGITANGGTNLAEGIRRAGGYLRRYGKGKNLSLIVLSDGNETCGGDPEAEMAALNGVMRTRRRGW